MRTDALVETIRTVMVGFFVVWSSPLIRLNALLEDTMDDSAGWERSDEAGAASAITADTLEDLDEDVEDALDTDQDSEDDSGDDSGDDSDD